MHAMIKELAQELKVILNGGINHSHPMLTKVISASLSEETKVNFYEPGEG